MVETHEALVAALRKATLEAAADTPASLRVAVAERAAGGPPITEPYDALASAIGGDSHRVTDAQVTAVRNSAGSERAAFEVIAAATLGASLRRWRAGIAALEAATHAAS